MQLLIRITLAGRNSMKYQKMIGNPTEVVAAYEAN
jgi:hypothetical protein